MKIVILIIMVLLLYGCEGEIKISNRPSYEVEDSIFVYYVTNNRWVATWDDTFFVVYGGTIDTLLWISELDTMPYNVHRPYKKSK